MISNDEDFDPDAILRDPIDDSNITDQECPVCGETLIWSQGQWICPNCTNNNDGDEDSME